MEHDEMRRLLTLRYLRTKAKPAAAKPVQEKSSKGPAKGKPKSFTEPQAAFVNTTPKG
jgi:valyl-tRNA synthetase